MLGTSPTTAGGKRWRSSTPGWAPCHTGDGREDGDEELGEAPYHTIYSDGINPITMELFTDIK